MYALALFLLFTLVPALETWGIIEIGRVIGGWETVLWLVLAGMLGAALGKRAGFQVLREVQAELAAGRSPGTSLVEGVLVLVGSLLLITPGLLTDVIGMLLFVGPVRRWIAPRAKAWLLRRVVVQGVSFGPGGPGPGFPGPRRAGGPSEAGFGGGADPARHPHFDHPVA